jgi:hypothetical protein
MKILQVVKDFLDSDGWKYTQIEGKTIFKLGFKGKSGTWNCFAQSKEEKEQFIFYSVLLNHVPENRRGAAAEYITRANYGLSLGNFEMDYSDGEVRYKIGVDVEGGCLTETMVKNMIYSNIITVDRYLPGLNEVVYGNIIPALAIQQSEVQANG